MICFTSIDHNSQHDISVYLYNYFNQRYAFISSLKLITNMTVDVIFGHASKCRQSSHLLHINNSQLLGIMQLTWG